MKSCQSRSDLLAPGVSPYRAVNTFKHIRPFRCEGARFYSGRKMT